MPLNALLTYVIGIALGWLLIRTTRVPYHLQGLVLGCCSAGKSIYIFSENLNSYQSHRSCLEERI